MEHCHFSEASKALAPWAQVLVTLVLGAFAGYIAWRQFELGRHKVRLDLYGRRYAVFEKVRDFLGHILSEKGANEADVEKANDFRFVIIESGFLFESEIRKLLDEIHKASFELGYFQKVADAEKSDVEARKKHLTDKSDKTKWLIEVQKNLELTFKPYLYFPKAI